MNIQEYEQDHEPKYKRSTRSKRFTPRMIAFFHQCFTYSKSTGILRWRKDRPAAHFKTEAAYKRYLKVNAGTPAGTPQGDGGHLQVQFSQHPTKKSVRNYCAYVHRIAYAMVEGEDPGPMLLDHKNGDTTDNRWSNLRLATKAENAHNRKASRHSTTGVLGVSVVPYKEQVRYLATLQKGGIRHARLFRTLQAATEQRHAWEREYHGKFAASACRPTLQ